MEFEKIRKIIAEEMNLNVEDVKPEADLLRIWQRILWM